jgi:hypothetical protein
MKDLRLELRIKNNHLYSAIMPRYASVAEFCREHHFSGYSVGTYINLKRSPLTVRRTPHKAPVSGMFIGAYPMRIAKALGVNFLDIFPSILHESRQNKFVAEVDAQEFLPYDDMQYVPLLEEPNKVKDYSSLYAALETLPESERDVIVDRFGLADHPLTLDQVAAKRGVTRERVRQIEMKGLRLLRHPQRSRTVKELMF